MGASPSKTQRRMRFIILSAGAGVLLVGAAIALCYTTPLSYFYCLTREKSWLAAKTEAELDRRMWAFYTKRPIAPSHSMWGSSYVLGPEERMVQYLVFAKEPLDVVLDRESRIVVAFTSYE
jgi:hypothetical protein